ncbi:hypothetical protein H8959_010264 [Pygathrix nigripes]
MLFSLQPCQFEQCIVCSLQSLKGVLECKPGEASVSIRAPLGLHSFPGALGNQSEEGHHSCSSVPRFNCLYLTSYTTSLVFLAKSKKFNQNSSLQVFQQPKTQEEVCQLSINIMQVFIYCLEQLSTKPDADIDTTHLSVDVSSPDLFGSIHEDFSLTSEHFEKHNFQGIEKITQVSMASLKELDQRLFENYIELKADPIVGSLEPGIYAGYFDWKDCLPPTGVRNYLKEALVNIIAVHAEVFTVSKELVPRVLSKVVEAVSEELGRLMQCVSSFSRNGALQARLEICALRDTVAVYLTPESKSSFKQALEALPQLSSGADKKLLEELLNKFKSSMHLQLTCFQAASSAMMKT